MTDPESRPLKPVFDLVANNPGDAVYGVIAVGALLAAESARQESYVTTIVAVIVTMILYWMAHSYAALAGQRLRSGGHLTISRLSATMVHELPILIGAALPLLTVLLCWVAGANLGTAIRDAIWTAVGIIIAIEVIAGVRSDLNTRQMISQAGLGALLGSMILLLRVILH